MTSDGWETLQTAFEHALELRAADLDEYLASFEREHPELLEQLRDMITAQGSDTFIKDAVAESLEAVLEEASDPLIGRSIDAWTIQDRVATGGMGTVFAADRSDRQFEQRVALKLMNVQMLEPDAIARFKAERQILADLNHPYIAQLHDGGTTEDGVPYLVMEFVDGLPIDRHCDDNRLSIDERLALFRKVCAAVDYAHRRLTVHRDLKPSNILVDVDGNPKLLDFGIAKLLDERAMNMTIAVTRHGMRAMTPAYASPEQVRGETVSVATDVYSLGVLFYQLMTGQSPYGLTGATALEFERAIVELDPKRPSTLVSRSDGNSLISETRRLTDKQLRNRLAGDLDNIAIKALQKEPERRYLSADALSADIGRYLRRQPVEARGDDWSYIARKFAVRNARGLAVTGIVIGGIAALTTFYTLQIADERDRANLAAAKANEVSEFLASVFDSASPLVQQGEEVSAANLLEQGIARVDGLGQQPQLQAELYRIMGESYTQLGKYSQAISLLEKSVELREELGDVDLLALAQSIEALAEGQRYDSDFDAAIANMRRALELRRAIHGHEHPEVARVLGRLGTALTGANYAEEALRTLNEALEMKRRLGGAPDVVTSDLLGNISVRLDTMGRYEEAATIGLEATAISEAVNGRLHPHTIIRMSNLAMVYSRQWKLDASASLFAESIERGRQTWGNEHPRLGYLVQFYGQVLLKQGRFDEALPLLEEAAEITRAGTGNQSLEFAGRLYGISTWYKIQARYDESIDILLRAHSISSQLQDDRGYFVLLTRLALGGIYVETGDWARAEQHLAHVVDNEQQLGRNLVLRAYTWLAMTHAHQGRAVQGRPLMQLALDEAAANNEASQLPLLVAATEFFRLANDFERSMAIGEHAHRVGRERLPPNNWNAANATAQYARTLHTAGRADEARPLLQSAHDDLHAVFGGEHVRVGGLAELLTSDSL